MPTDNGRKVGLLLIAFLRFEELESKSKTVDKISHVLIRVQDVKTFDGEPYEVYHVDCIKSNGSFESYDDVLDVMIE